MAFKEDAITERYKEVEKLLHYITRRFHQTYGGDLEDLTSEANYLFLTAYDGWNTQLSPFHKRVGFVVWKGLLDKLRKERRRVRGGSWTRVDVQVLDYVSKKESRFHLRDFLDSLSEEARFVVNLVLEPPPDVVMNVALRGRETTLRLHNAVLEFLQDMDWDANLVEDCFQEVRTCLEGGEA